MARERAVALGHPQLIDEAALVTSELVTNAVLHGGGCRSIEVDAVDDGLLVRVSDPSRVPPVMGRPSEESLTGRGLQLVARVASSWGADAEESGKTVWALVTGQPAVSAPVDEDELLARWDEQWDDAPGAATRYHVVLGDVPTDLLLAAKSHVDNIVREFALVSAGAQSGSTAEVPPHLAALLNEVVGDFSDARLGIKHQALHAARHELPRTNLVLDLPVTAADAGERYVEALDEIDAYCRAKRLLTLETPPQHRAFRRWYVEELARQLRAAAAGEPVPAVQSFERHMLRELDRVSEARRIADRAARLYAVAAALVTADTVEAVAQAVVNEGVAALGASGGGMLIATEADNLTVPSTVGYDEAVVARLRTEKLDAELPAAVALRTREPVWIESRAERDSRFPELVGLEPTTVSMCAVPLVVRGRGLGALRFSFNEARLFDEDERRFVTALAAQTAQALDRAQLQQVRADANRRLQRSLLPVVLPIIGGLEVAAMYRPAGDGMELGGDFYDVWDMGEHGWGVVVGDASGADPEAAALATLVRHSLRALAIVEDTPEGVLRRVNQSMLDAAIDAERFCTLLVGYGTTTEGIQLELASGGHPCPIVRREDGRIEEVALDGALLGAFEAPRFSTHQVALRPGDTLVLFTDGVTEARRPNGPFFGTEGIEAVLSSGPRGAQDRVDAIEAAVLRHTGGQTSDDMAVVVLHAPLPS